MAVRTFPIQLTPEYSAMTRPMMPTVTLAFTAALSTSPIVDDKPAGSCPAIPLRRSSSRCGWEDSTNPAMENATISIGTTAKKEK